MYLRIETRVLQGALFSLMVVVFVMQSTSALTETEANKCRGRMLEKTTDFPQTIRPLGITVKEIPSSYLTESSCYTNNPGVYGAQRAGLNDDRGWRTTGADQWLQLATKNTFILTHIRTAGSPQYTAYVTTFTLAFKKSPGDHFTVLKNNKGNEVIFTGNIDTFNSVTQLIEPAIKGRYLRFFPKTWYNFIALRLEVYGWYTGNYPLGMENHYIKGENLKASSQLSTGHTAAESRIQTTDAWMPASDDTEPWLQVELPRIAVVSAIKTKPRKNYEFLVKTYTVSFGWKEDDLQPYKKNGQVEIFQGNQKKDKEIHNQVLPTITAKVIRIHPRTGTSAYSLTIELLGYYGDVKHATSYLDCANLCVLFLCDIMAYFASDDPSEVNCKVGPRDSWLLRKDFDKAWLFYENQETTGDCPSDHSCLAPAQCKQSLCSEAGKGYTCVCTAGYSGEHCQYKTLQIDLRGSGDIGTPCKIRVNNVERSLAAPGINVVVINQTDGNIVDSKKANTGTQPSASGILRNFLENLPQRQIVLLATYNDTYTELTTNVRTTIVNLGATEPFLAHRGSSFVMIGYTGPGKLGFQTQVTNDDTPFGTAELFREIQIPLGNP